MHKLIGAAGRRTASLAAGLVLTGGLAGGVLLTPGTAYASTSPTITISASPGFGGISVNASVTNGTTPLGTFSASASGTGGSAGSCTGNLTGNNFFGSGNGSGSGNCTISPVQPGTYTVTADYGGSSSNSVTVTIGGNPNPAPTSGSAPAFSADSPPTSVDSQSYSYQFQASGSPTYQLSGAPSWLNIDSSTGMVSGTIPDGTTSFSFSVMAGNNFGWITRGPWTVFFRHSYQQYSYTNIHTYLRCSSYVYTGQRGSCTLWVTNGQNYYWGQNYNFGQNFASDVTARISLPWPLRADYCFADSFCRIFGNTATANLGRLYPGHSAHLTVVFTAESGFSIWGWHPGHSFKVRVTGSAYSYGNGNFFPFGQQESFSFAYVTIIPRGFWW
jgi:hypothetical protein